MPYYLIIAPTKSRVYVKYLSFLNLKTKEIDHSIAPFNICVKALKSLGFSNYLMPDEIVENIPYQKKILYHHQDSHWNLLGAAEVYNLLANRHNLPPIEIDKIHKENRTSKEIERKEDLQRLIPNEYIKKLYYKKPIYFIYKKKKPTPSEHFKVIRKKGIVEIKPFTKDDAHGDSTLTITNNKTYITKKNVLIIGDSFRLKIRDFLIKDFHKVFSLHIDFFNEKVYNFIKNKHRIDLVIDVRHELFIREERD